MEFVDFNLAKKLNEKGFNWDRITTYNTMTKVRNNHLEPTISQVLKWLRKEKKIYIEIFLYKGKYSYFVKSVTQMEEDDFFHKHLNEDAPDEEYDTPEQAALAGIEYVCNNNLI